MKNDVVQQKEAYSIPEFCFSTGICRATAYRFINSGQLQTYTVGTRRYISRRARDQFIADREAESSTQGPPCARPLRKVKLSGNAA